MHASVISLTLTLMLSQPSSPSSSWQQPQFHSSSMTGWKKACWICSYFEKVLHHNVDLLQKKREKKYVGLSPFKVSLMCHFQRWVRFQCPGVTLHFSEMWLDNLAYSHRDMCDSGFVLWSSSVFSIADASCVPSKGSAVTYSRMGYFNDRSDHSCIDVWVNNKPVVLMQEWAFQIVVDKLW